MEIPSRLQGLSEDELIKLIDSTKREICKLEQEIIIEFQEEKQELAKRLEEEANKAGEKKDVDRASKEDKTKAGGDNKEEAGKDGQEEQRDKVAGANALDEKSMELEACAQDGQKQETKDDVKGEKKQEVKADAQDENKQETKAEAQDEKKKKKKEEEAKKDDDEYDIWKPPKKCVPIRADVRSFNFKALAEAQRRATGRLFDVIMTDPPWQLATSNPTRGVAIGYQQLSDSLIEQIPFPKLQDNGFLFVWVINAKYKFALELMEKWGYTLVDEIAWVKRTVNRRLAKSHGFYLQHAKETCLVGKKGNVDPPNTKRNVASDILFSERRGQSQKPVEIYEIIEELVPGGTYLEVFGRRNNLRDSWVTVGNEL
uniref:mRNA m(6)A methyltransferase n=1 Tax=Mucochytrium quahogii TaxID=96639 RepID=A0A7S2RKT2_9STRA